MPPLFRVRRREQGPRRFGLFGTARLAVAPLAAGLAIGASVYIALPRQLFRTVSVVGPEAGAAKESFDMRQVAAAALSRSVLRSAAAELVGRKEALPLPGPLERLGLIKLDGEADRVARLADQLAAAAHAAASGDALMIGVEAGEARRAAVLAQALAGAFLAKRAEQLVGAQRTREAELAARLAAAETTAAAARKRFVAAGGADAAVEKSRAAAGAELREAEARVVKIRSLMKTGTPPVADDVAGSQAITDLQASYLDLQGKLAQALQTLGERHTTVITLRDSIRRTGAELSAAWTRQLHAAEADRDAAKAREATLFRNDPGRDAGRQATLEEAKRAKEAADAALLRAEAELDFLPDQPAFALRAAAAVPSRAAEGWSPGARGALGLIAGIAAALALLAARLGLAALAAPRRAAPAAAARRAAPERARPEGMLFPPTAANDSVVAGRPRDAEASAIAQPPRTDALAMPPTDPAMPAAADRSSAPALSVWTTPLRGAADADAPPHAAAAAHAAGAHAAPATSGGPRAATAPAAAASAMTEPTGTAGAEGERPEPSRFFRGLAVQPGLAAIDEASAPHASPVRPIAARSEAALMPDAPPRDAPPPNAWPRDAAAEHGEGDALRLMQAGFRNLVGGLRALAPANGPIPTLMVVAPPRPGSTGAGDEAASTTDVALAIGEVAAAAGLRVLLVEASRQRGLLAEHAAGERRPALVGMRDGLRLVYAADAVAGLFLAPLYRRRAELVAALSRHRRAGVVERVAARFDLLIVDGGDAAQASRAGWTADRYLAVGIEPTLADGARILAALDHPAGILAGTVVGARYHSLPGGVDAVGSRRSFGAAAA